MLIQRVKNIDSMAHLKMTQHDTVTYGHNLEWVVAFAASEKLEFSPVVADDGQMLDLEPFMIKDLQAIS